MSIRLRLTQSRACAVVDSSSDDEEDPIQRNPDDARDKDYDDTEGDVEEKVNELEEQYQILEKLDAKKFRQRKALFPILEFIDEHRGQFKMVKELERALHDVVDEWKLEKTNQPGQFHDSKSLCEMFRRWCVDGKGNLALDLLARGSVAFESSFKRQEMCDGVARLQIPPGKRPSITGFLKLADVSRVIEREEATESTRGEDVDEVVECSQSNELSVHTNEDVQFQENTNVPRKRKASDTASQRPDKFPRVDIQHNPQFEDDTNVFRKRKASETASQRPNKSPRLNAQHNPLTITFHNNNEERPQIANSEQDVQPEDSCNEFEHSVPSNANPFTNLIEIPKSIPPGSLPFSHAQRPIPNHHLINKIKDPAGIPGAELPTMGTGLKFMHHGALIIADKILKSIGYDTSFDNPRKGDLPTLPNFVRQPDEYLTKLYETIYQGESWRNVASEIRSEGDPDDPLAPWMVLTALIGAFVYHDLRNGTVPWLTARQNLELLRFDSKFIAEQIEEQGYDLEIVLTKAYRRRLKDAEFRALVVRTHASDLASECRAALTMHIEQLRRATGNQKVDPTQTSDWHEELQSLFEEHLLVKAQFEADPKAYYATWYPRSTPFVREIMRDGGSEIFDNKQVAMTLFPGLVVQQPNLHGQPRRTVFQAQVFTEKTLRA